MLFNKISVKTKYGFSLFEVVVTMSIIAIFIAAASNIFTQKFKRKLALPIHGRFECYYDDDGDLHEKQVSEKTVIKDEKVSADANGRYYCSYDPVKAAAYLVINGVGGGGAGASNYGGSAGDYKSIFLPTTTHKLRIVPGKGATNATGDSVDKNFGDATLVYDVDSAPAGSSFGRIVINIPGGRSAFDNPNDAFVRSCRISYTGFTCLREPYCSVDNTTRRISVGYCEANGDDIKNEKQESLTYTDLINGAQSGFDMTTQVLSYSKLTTEEAGYINVDEVIYTIAVQFEGNFTEASQLSGFESYLNALELEDGVAALARIPGSGGAKQSSGGDGAVVIAW